MVNIFDIAHSLSMNNRFTGHTKFPYPVSQHSRLGSYLVPPRYAMRFLLHDASEAYIGDVNRPLKHFTSAGVEYRKIEAPIQALIYNNFGLAPEDPEIIHEIDNQMLYAEKEQIMAPTPWRNEWSKDRKAADVEIIETPFHRNELLFLVRFYEILRSGVSQY
jgi:hypothetical protein